MWQQIKNFWKSVNLLEESWIKSIEMLKICEDMFQEAHKALREAKERVNLEQLRKKDKLVNKYLRDIRKNVITHLSVQAPKGLPEGLVLVSIGVDIERIGDYSKNIAELATFQQKKLNLGTYKEDIKKIETAVLDSFQRVNICLKEGNPEKALHIMKDYKDINKLCDSLIEKIIQVKDSKLSSGESASLALYLRALKRLNSHLINIASGVVNPFHRIGFKPKKKMGN
jgi:phosphate transport system protein